MNINKQYQDLVRKIYEDGFEYEDPNRKGVIRKQIPHYTLKHSFTDGFPAIGLKQTYPKQAFSEMKSFLMGKTNIIDLEKLGVTFWRKDAYNYYVKHFNKKYPNSSQNLFSFEEWSSYLKDVSSLENNKFQGLDNYKYGDLGRIYSHQIRNWNSNIDQLKNVVERLKKNPMTTKNVVTMWNPSDLEECALSPCHWSFELIVEKVGPYKLLTIAWNQGSVDTFLGLPVNIMYYSFLCYVLADYLDMTPSGIIGNLSNVHLYDNSFDKVEELLKRDYTSLTVPLIRNIKIEEESYNNLDDFLEKLDYYNCEIVNYSHLGKLNVEMLAYSK